MNRQHSLQTINYPPWIGNDYDSRGNLRLMIVGRSYFDARYKDSTLNSFISSLSKGKVHDTFYTALELVLSDQRHWKSSLGGKLKLDRKKYWNSVCYHQYIQGILPDGYSPIPKEMWKEAQDVFQNVLMTLQPELVIMAGEDIFDNMPTLGGRQGKTYSFQGSEMKTWILNPGKAECRIGRMLHPRDTSFNIEVWKEIYYRFSTDYLGGGF